MALLALQVTASAINPVLVGPGPGLIWYSPYVPEEPPAFLGDFTSADVSFDITIGADGGGF